MSGCTKLRLIRKKKGETVSGMARKLKIGVSRYYMIETGERPATPEIAENIAKLLKVKTQSIFVPNSFTVRQVGDDKVTSTGTDGS